MLGIIVQLALSWLIVWLFGKKNLGVLGLFPTKRRLLDFSIFFFITAACCSFDFILRILFAGQQWKLNPALSFKLILDGVWWNIKSVLFEELIFRGVLLYILIKKLGAVKAIIISAIAFGIYHWFSFEILGNLLQMTIVFIVTGLMGVVLAYGYAKTFSLFIPIAIHLGWNLTTSVIFSDKIIGHQLLIKVKPAIQVQVSYFTYYFITIFPISCVLLIGFLLIKKKKQVELSS